MFSIQDIQALCGIVTTICTVVWIVNQWMLYSMISKQMVRYQERADKQITDKSHALIR